MTKGLSPWIEPFPPSRVKPTPPAPLWSCAVSRAPCSSAATQNTSPIQAYGKHATYCWRKEAELGLTCRASRLSSIVLGSFADHHHGLFQAAGLTQSRGGVGVREAAQRLSVYRQHLISFLNGALLSCQAAGKHSVDLDEDSECPKGHLLRSQWYI